MSKELPDKSQIKKRTFTRRQFMGGLGGIALAAATGAQTSASEASPLQKEPGLGTNPQLLRMTLAYAV